MEEKQGISTLRKMAVNVTAENRATKRERSDTAVMTEDTSPEVARENIVKEMMRLFDGLLGCTSKRTGVNLATIKTTLKTAVRSDTTKPERGAQRTFEKEIYRLVKGLVELDSPNIGFAVNVLYNNGTYYYNKANVPLSFGVFLNSLVEFLEGHDCCSACPEEMGKLKSLLTRG